MVNPQTEFFLIIEFIWDGRGKERKVGCVKTIRILESGNGTKSFLRQNRVN